MADFLTAVVAPVAPSFARGVRGRDPCPSRTQVGVLGVWEGYAATVSGSR